MEIKIPLATISLVGIGALEATLVSPFWAIRVLFSGRLDLADFLNIRLIWELIGFPFKVIPSTGPIDY